MGDAPRGPGHGRAVRAVLVTPGADDPVRLADVDEPDASAGLVLAETLEVGVCGTDAQVVSGAIGRLPEGHRAIVLGHEGLGRVLSAPEAAPVAEGDLVSALVRRPDPVPCDPCGAGSPDLCENGRYTEHGITALDGFLRERWDAWADRVVRVPEELRDVGVLTEPTSVVAKALRVARRVRGEDPWEVRRAVVLGAGPVGLLATALLRLDGVEVATVDLVEPGTPRAAAVDALGAEYVRGDVEPLDDLVGRVGAPDLVLEATGVPSLVVDAVRAVGRNGVVALVGTHGADGALQVPVGAVNDALVDGNRVVIGSVNAHRRDALRAVAALGAAVDRWPGVLEGWLRRVPLDDVVDALDVDPSREVKKVVTLSS